MTLSGLAGAARCRLASRRGEEHRGHDRRQILSCGWVSIHLVVNDEITKDRTLANPPLRPLGNMCHRCAAFPTTRQGRQDAQEDRGRREREKAKEKGKRTGEERREKEEEGGELACACARALVVAIRASAARANVRNSWNSPRN